MKINKKAVAGGIIGGAILATVLAILGKKNEAEVEVIDDDCAEAETEVEDVEAVEVAE